MGVFLSALCLTFLLPFAHASVPVPYVGKVSIDAKNFTDSSSSLVRSTPHPTRYAPPSVLPIASGIMIDKMRQSEGEATQTIEVKKSITLEDVRNELSELKRDALDRGNIKLIDLGQKVK
jgi:hypothetical protein